MDSLTIVGALITIVVIIAYANVRSYFRGLSKEIALSEAEYRVAADEFQSLFSLGCYVNQRLVESWLNKYAHLQQIILGCPRFALPQKLKEITDTFTHYFKDVEVIRNDFNSGFVDKEKIIYKSLFDDLEDYPLDDQQRTAILHDEDNTLVIAGAGTGKTSAIVGKAAYILESKLASEDEMLLITFTKNAADEMQERIEERLGKNVPVRTFNAFGYDVIGEVEGNKPDLLFGGDDKGGSKVKGILIKSIQDGGVDNKLIINVASFFLFYFFPEQKFESFKTLDEYYSFVKSVSLITFQGETVKSFEELKIANFLYMNGIEYKYEEAFDTSIRSSNYKPYKPDFYLTEYDITIEHWGINKNGKVPAFFSKNNESATEKYHDKMAYARQLHDERKRTLIETYSYEENDGVLLPKLKEKLENAEVVFKQRPFKDILKKIKTGKSFSPFIDLVYTFLVLVKSNHVEINKLKEKANKQKSKRATTFLEIFTYLFEAYESYLKEHNEIDFNDMIIRATEHIKFGRYSKKYKYILVDEFQDMSIGRYNLLKSLLDQNPQAKLFCVGDDWQSIFRFTGSDISITTLFDEYFGYTYHAKLESTHRFNNKILDYTSSFIQKNPSQLRKKLKSETVVSPDYVALDIRTYEGIETAELQILHILEEIREKFSALSDKRLSVLLIGRYNNNVPKNLDLIKKQYKSVMDISYLTAHKAKGTTFNYSILIDVNAGTFGFPSEIIDDPLLQLVLHKGDEFENAEERRLFYVALTRARDANYIIAKRGNESKFLKELQKNSATATGDENGNVICPECQGKLIRRSSEYGNFFGCSNYPLCQFTKSD